MDQPVLDATKTCAKCSAWAQGFGTADLDKGRCMNPRSEYHNMVTDKNERCSDWQRMEGPH